MKKSKLILTSFLCSAGVLGYIILVAAFLNNAGRWFGETDNFWSPVIFLMLFVFSALITGLLVLGYPIWLYLENKKKDAALFLGYNAGWLLAILVIAFIIMSLLA